MLEQTVQERTAELRESEARYRSLTELASDWYWEQDENGELHQGVRPGAGDAGHPRRCLRRRAPSDAGATAGTRRSGASCRRRIAARAAVPGFRVQPRQRRRLAAASSRSAASRCSTSPAASSAIAASAWKSPQALDYRLTAQSMSRRPYSPSQNHLLAALPRGGIRARWRRTWSGWRCRSARCCTSPGGTAAARLLPDHRDRLAALRDGVGRVGGNRRRRQRRHGRHLAVHGRQHHAEFGRGADRGPRLPAGAPRAEGGVRPRAG